MATILILNGPPTSGTSGSYPGAAYGDEIIDVANLLRYINTSNIAGSPTWTALGSVTTGTQTWSGDKTFSGNTTFSGTITANNTSTFGSALVLNNAATFRRTPSTTQNLTLVTDTISAFQNVKFTTGSNLTLTSAPTIADAAAGNQCRLTNVGSFNLVLSDQGTLANSNLRLTATTVTIAPRQTLELEYNATIGDWIQVTPLCTVL